MPNEDYRTIKIKAETYPKLRLLAAMTGESMVDLIDRLVTEEKERTQNPMKDAPARDLLPAERIARIAQLAECDTKIAADYINSEWDNQADHEEWIATAGDAEIADWIKACRK